MKRSLYLLALSVPLMLGASLPPVRPTVPPHPGNVVEVNVLDRFLEDAGVKKRPSERPRSRAQGKRNATPKPPALANVPIPVPKPAEGTLAISEEKPAPEQDQSQANAAPPEPRAEEPAPRDTAGSEKADAAPVPKPTPEPTPEPAKPDEAPPPAEDTVTDGAAKPPVVEQPATATEPARQAEVPKPLPKPETDGAAKPEETKPGKTPQDEVKEKEVPQDEAKPDGKSAEEGETEKAEEPPPPPLVEEDPQELQACLADLKAIGAKFEPTDPINEGNGCGIKQPIDVAEVLPGVDLGGATMRCKTALTMAHWLKDTVQPAMNVAMPGRKIVRLVPGSTYQCRLRNGASTGKISEHARGNAFDVAAFKLDNGETIEMKPRDEDSTLEGAFQRTATAGACLHFTTVLSPGSDAAHQDHLHLDVLERTNGYRYCR
jgi:hypothetical protein